MSKKIEHRVIEGLECKSCSSCKQWVSIDDYYKNKSRWDGLSDKCKKCAKQYMNPRRKEYNKRHWQKHKPNRLKFLVCQNCGEEFKIKRFIWEKFCSAYCRRHHWEHTEKGMLRRRYEGQKRRERIENAGELTPIIIKGVYDNNVKEYGELTCIYCKLPCGESWHLEHKTPLSRGGTNEENNLAIACPACNLEKFTKTEEEYIIMRKAVQQ